MIKSVEGSGVEVNTDVSPISSSEEESEEVRESSDHSLSFQFQNDRKKRDNNDEPRLLF